MARGIPESTKIRRDKILSLLTQGATVTEMSKVIDCDRNTIYSDIKALKKEISLTFSTEEKREIVFNILGEDNELKRKLWDAARRYKDINPNAEIGALKAVMELRKDRIYLLEKLGLIEKIPDKLDITTKISQNDLHDAYTEFIRRRKAEQKPTDGSSE